MLHKSVGWASINRPPAPPQHRCMTCEHTWPATDRRVYWPIRLRWGVPSSSAPFGTRHGWQVGTTTDGRRTFGWTWHWGRFKVCFGPRGYQQPRRLACPSCDTTYWERPS
jgi:hypothetical protein